MNVIYCYMTLEALHYNEILMLPLGGLHAINIQFVPHTKPIRSPVQRTASFCCLGKQQMFTV
jgi:hypothetical protein